MKTRFLAHAHHEQNNPEGGDSLATEVSSFWPTGKTTFEVHVQIPLHGSFSFCICWICFCSWSLSSFILASRTCLKGSYAFIDGSKPFKKVGISQELIFKNNNNNNAVSKSYSRQYSLIWAKIINRFSKYWNKS